MLLISMISNAMYFTTPFKLEATICNRYCCHILDLDVEIQCIIMFHLLRTLSCFHCFTCSLNVEYPFNSLDAVFSMWYSKFKELIVRLIVKFIYTVIQSVETSFVFQ